MGAAASERIRSHLARGAPWDACDEFRHLTTLAPEDPDLLYWGALAYARVGARRDALALLDKAQSSAKPAATPREELLSLRGRIWKDHLLRAKSPAERNDLAGKAREQYLAGYVLRRENTYPGINAATLSLIIGDRQTAGALAKEILHTIAARESTNPDDWDDATAGEAHLLLGEIEFARQRYARARSSAGNSSGQVASMRQQIMLLADALPDAAALLDVLSVPQVLAFVGHLIDSPGRMPARFPAEAIPHVADAVRQHLTQAHPPIVYTSAACGADLIGIECALEAGCEVNVVLPFDREDFVHASVAVAGAEWVSRFERLLPRVEQVFVATEERYLGDDILFDHASRLIEGLAVLRAGQLSSKPSMLCVLDSESTGGQGGARSSFERWKRHHGTPTVIDLKTLRDPRATHSPEPAGPDTGTRPDALKMPGALASMLDQRPRRTLKSLLFADFAGFGRLHDAYAPLFHARFLEIGAAEVNACPVPPLEVNTWGDALYVVFEEARDAAAFALSLLQRMLAEDWTAAGLSPSSQIRVAMHTGPVFCGFDPLIGRDNYFGSSVTRAARIEPVTPAGQVYVSEAFAATLVAEGQTGYEFEYVGRLALAKAHGHSRIYRLERA